LLRLILCFILCQIATLRFDLILARYLYQNKILNLPGIGTFEAGASDQSREDDKQSQSLANITFRSNPVTTADDNLIEFIKVETGKMKPLAASDLESYLTSGKQFLYIGKPFYMEGIGTLQMSKDRHIHFVPGEYITTKLEDPNLERSEGKLKAVKEENRVKQETSNNRIKKFMLAFLILAIIALAGWGVYYLFVYFDQQTATNMSKPFLPAEDSMQSLFLQDTMSQNNNNEQNIQDISISNAHADMMYKFVVETTYNKIRAINKFNFLRTYGKNVQLETPDSVFFKLYFSLPATTADTLRIRDSLNNWYYGNTNTIRVRVE